MPIPIGEGWLESVSWVPFERGNGPASTTLHEGSYQMLDLGRAAETDVDEHHGICHLVD